MLVEVCVQSVEAAVIAAEAGADRLELCEKLVIGGISPSEALVREIQASSDIPLQILIRPDDGGFVYSNSEYEKILEAIHKFMELGVSGIVVGVLKKNHTIDLNRMIEIRSLTKDLHLTFHRAFDQVPNPRQAIKDLENIGVNTVLTSGQRNTALEGLDLLRDLKQLVSQLTIMPGAGINPENIKTFKEAGFKAVHFSGTRKLGKAPGIPGSQLKDEYLNTPKLIFEPDWVRSMIHCVK
ncbi:MAG: copper homeostasis protein CutC [Flavobacteriaceae bacterium]|nr:copper homeostasis protein CutC [Flavobacteriaceae bacterium]